MDELAGRAWEEDFVEIRHHQVAPHYRHSMAVQTILPDRSRLGNLVRNIPEVITTLRGKPKLQAMLQMTTEQMELIDKEITASNARKFGKSISQGHIFRNSTTNNGTQMREQITWMSEYQQCVDVAKGAKTRQFYTSCNVQTGRRSISNTIKHLNK